MELTDSQSPIVEDKIALESSQPIGDVIIGNIDPITLTKEQFESSPDLLYHGTGDASFKFSRTIDYINFDRPVSATIGEGFYCTNNPTDAGIFSRITSRGPTPQVITFLPYEAKMLDLRKANNLQENAPVPNDLLTEWVSFYQEQWKTALPENYDDTMFLKDIQFANTNRGNEAMKEVLAENNRRRTRYQHGKDYIMRLKISSAKKQALDLRQMLSLNNSAANSEFAAREFPKFMTHKGYDGLIYVEGGDHPDQRARNPVSYVFYNLEKIGTFDTWHGK